MPLVLQNVLVLLFLVAAALITIYTQTLTKAGAVGGVIVGWCVYLGAHFTGLAMLAAFFILGTAATIWKRDIKEKIKEVAKEHHARHLSQVLANGGMAAICGLLAFILPDSQSLFSVMMAAALSTATADTLSSELGTLYGKRFFNISTFKKDKRGLDGVISLEGLFIGMIGSCVIALLFILGYTLGLAASLTVVAAGTIGNLTDSLLGAMLERKHLVGNNTVNFIATITGAIIGGACFMLS